MSFPVPKTTSAYMLIQETKLVNFPNMIVRSNNVPITIKLLYTLP